MAKKGLIARFIEGPERSEDYARNSLPSNRWELGWDIFKSNLTKMVGLNLLMLLFFAPIIVVIFLRYIDISAMQKIYPLNVGVGFGYPGFGETTGLAEQIVIRGNMNCFILLLPCIFIVSVGLSGGLYVMKRLVWAENVSIGTDFWTGIKKNYVVVMLSTLFYAVVVCFLILSISTADYLIAVGNNINFLLVIGKVLCIIMIAFVTMAYLFMLTLGVTYKLKFRHLIRNSAILSIGMLITNVFFALFSVVCFIPLFFINLSFLFTVGLFLTIFIGFSVAILIWTNYSHWIFDRFINENVAGAKRNRGIYKKNAEEDNGEQAIFEKSRLITTPIKPVTDYDVEIYELPTSFTRADLQKLEESKEAMRQDSDRYVEEHKNDKLKENENNGDGGDNSFESLLSEEEKNATVDAKSLKKTDKK